MKDNVAPRHRATMGAAVVALAAIGWLFIRLFYGLDFTDEMQYYGELSSLVRHGRFFGDDLFVQQLGYLPLLPIFALHRWFFSDQAFLILFGRVLLIAAYAICGLQLWQTGRRRGFSATACTAGVASVLVWIPFQIFAFGYNSLSYLLVLGLVGAWLNDQANLQALLLGWLGIAYPPAGITLAALLLLERNFVHGSRATLLFLGRLLFVTIAATAIFQVLHRGTFFSELAVALKFSRTFGVAEVILLPSHLVAWAALLLATGLIGWRGNRVPLPAVALITGLGAVALFVLSPRISCGYAASGGFLVVALLAKSTAAPAHAPTVRKIILAGALVGSMFAITSGNGVHNFGLGVIPFVPWLALMSVPETASARLLSVIPLVAAALLLNGVFHPYRENYLWQPLRPIEGVPAFSGMHVAPVKVEAIDYVRGVAATEHLAGARLLVAGPHPWIYFASGAIPVTPMFFMHFSGDPAAYALVAERLFANGQPDVVIIPNATPISLAPRITAWAVSGTTAKLFPLPADFISRYASRIGYDFSPEIAVMRKPRTP